MGLLLPLPAGWAYVWEIPGSPGAQAPKRSHGLSSVVHPEQDPRPGRHPKPGTWNADRLVERKDACRSRSARSPVSSGSLRHSIGERCVHQTRREDAKETVSHSGS
ncbi:UNVERIFIED_CONTAM: hypothetical protein K2H54_051744 [Gekko kuhli]